MLDAFISALKNDLQRQNRFDVWIKNASRQINMFAETVTIPGQNIRSTPDALRHGPTREHAQGFTYGPISINFLCSPGMPERKFFEDWQERVVVKDAWRAQFYDDYVGEIHIRALDKGNKALYRVEVHEAYPKTINAVDFSLGSSDSYQVASIEFAYRWWSSHELGSVDTSRAAALSKARNTAPAPVDDFSDIGPAEVKTKTRAAGISPMDHYAPPTSQPAPGKPF